jgi:hypothetical protein
LLSLRNDALRLLNTGASSTRSVASLPAVCVDRIVERGDEAASVERASERSIEI